jgi:SAM-dependent methyltransferase
MAFDRGFEEFYASRPYLEAYSEHTDALVERDPQLAVGGLWDQIGELQFAFLVRQGLQPHHTLLDIGCGTLRGGRHFIEYLEPGNYTGMDISANAIAYGRQLVEEEGLSEKRPKLLVSENKNLKFEELAGEAFDFLLAQSVFTHLEPDHITECLRHVGRIMSDDSVFYFTFNEASRFSRSGLTVFRYPVSFLRTLADENGFAFVDLSAEYRHPRTQRMVALSKRALVPH